MAKPKEKVTKYFTNPEKEYKPKALHNVQSFVRVKQACKNGATREELQTALSYTDSQWKTKVESDEWKKAAGSGQWTKKWQDHKSFIGYLAKGGYLITKQV